MELAGELVTLARVLHAEFHGANPLRPQVVLVDAGPEVLASFSPRLRQHARGHLAEMGVKIRMVRQASGVDEHGINLSVPGDTHECIEARTVIWAAGVGALTVRRGPGAGHRDAGGPQGRVSVRPDCSLPGHPDIFVIGRSQPE